jgi:NAD(P)-dependent dehydrogenase (short-subunit alcohol dehydrogenase family)
MGMTLDGQVAIVTGGARGQGRADAVALASLGARVVLCDVPAALTSVGYELGTAEDLDLTVSLAKEATSPARSSRSASASPRAH